MGADHPHPNQNECQRAQCNYEPLARLGAQQNGPVCMHRMLTNVRAQRPRRASRATVCCTAKLASLVFDRNTAVGTAKLALKESANDEISPNRRWTAMRPEKK